MAHRDMAWVVKGKLAQLLGNAGLSRVGRFRSLVRDRMRPPREVHQHVKKLSRGPRATLRSPSKKSRRKKQHAAVAAPPPFSLEEVHKSVLIVDKQGGWRRGWKENFQSLRIGKLRSLMSAHTDPYDHRSLEYYAEAVGRGDELVTLPNLCQRDQHFTGPYQVSQINVAALLQ